MDYKQMTAPCGLDCFNCPLYLAKDDEELQAKFAQVDGVSAERPYCLGCRNEEGWPDSFEMPKQCNLYECVERRGLEFCFECDRFPCDYLHPYADKADILPHNTKLFNLCLIQKMGLGVWAEEKAMKVKNTYFCSAFPGIWED